VDGRGTRRADPGDQALVEPEYAATAPGFLEGGEDVVEPIGGHVGLVVNQSVGKNTPRCRRAGEDTLMTSKGWPSVVTLGGEKS
jgi:hypothetical protein